MASRKDGRIEKGQPVAKAISARAWNRAQQAADVVLGVSPELGVDVGRGKNRAYEWAYCRTTVSVGIWHIVAITGIENTPSGTADDPESRSYQDTPVLTGGTPSANTTAWGVAVEPIESGKIGRLAVSGVVQIKASDLSKASGCQLIWKNSDWALITIGGGLRLGTISAAWPKGTTATVTEQNGDGTEMADSPEFTATNHFASIAVSSGVKRVACGKAGDKWILIAAEC